MPKAHPSSFGYRVIAGIVRPLMFSITRRDWQGGENFPTDSGFIVASNHMTNFDPLTLAHYVYDNGRLPQILAKASLWKVFGVRQVLDATHMIPVARGSVDAGESLRVATQALHDGACIAIFPEGTLTREPDLWPMVGKTGMARLALTSRVPVVPVAQWGAQDVLGRYSKVFKPIPRKLVHVHAGPPVDLSDLYDRPLDVATLREATNRVLDAITALLAEIRGEEPPATRFDPRKRPVAAAADEAVPAAADEAVADAARESGTNDTNEASTPEENR